MKLSDKIIGLRKSNGMSQEDLAEKLDVSRQAISRWESGTAMPDANNILQLSKLFGVTTDYLLNDDYQSDNDLPKVKEVQNDTMSEQKENDKQKFLEIRNGIASENQDAVMAEREAIRSDGKVGLIQKLYAVYKDKYHSEVFAEASRQIDAGLQEEPIQKKKRSISEQLKAPRQEVAQLNKQKKEYER